MLKAEIDIGADVRRQRQRDKNQCKINYAVARRKTPRKTNRRQQDEVGSV